MDNIPASLTASIKREIKRIIDEVYDGNIKAGDIDTKLLKHVGSALENQVTAGFGKTFAQVDFTTPDAAMLTRLTRDVWHFSAAKNYQQLRDMTLALKDENGKLRSFNDFKEAARLDDEKYRRWLNTEWNQAIGGSTMAARWAEFKQNADIMPYLKYDTVGDDNVRDEHQALDGIVRKIADEFWKRYFPPNGWGCRCSANQLSTSYAKETDQIPDVKIPKMFQTNLAESGLVFPKDHAYYNGVPNNILEKAMAYLPKNAAYFEIDKGINVHKLHGIDEMNINIELAKLLKENKVFKRIDLLPILDKDNNSLREVVYGTKKFVRGKNPDALADGSLFDFTTLSNPTRNRLADRIYKKAIKAGTKQADNLVIHLGNELSENDINRVIKGKFNQSTSVNKIVVIDVNGKVIIKQNPNYKK